MSDLIEDFPKHRQNTFYGSKRKSVGFSETCDLRIFQCHDDIDERDIWYSEDDYKNMKSASKKAANVAHRVLGSHSMSDANSAVVEALDDYINLTGIERFLSPKSIKKAIAARTERTNAVMREQERQYWSGKYDIHKLACESRRHTKWAIRRAHTIGMFNAQISE